MAGIDEMSDVRRRRGKRYLAAAVRNRHAQFAHAGKEAFYMIIESKKFTLPDMSYIVYRIRVGEAPVKDRYFGLIDGQHLSIDIDYTV